MATLAWDLVGERVYQSGIDRGVLYLHDGRSAPWNGLLGIEDSTSLEIKTSYLDGVKYLEMLIPGDFAGKLKAFTYPDIFDSVTGIAELITGFSVHDQPSKSFGLSYRTLIGNDVDGLDFGYKIHILYNINANPDTASFNTLNDQGVQPVEFSWSLTGTPPPVHKVRPSVHITIDSIDTPPEILAMIEGALYGSEFSEPTLPSIQQIAEYFGYLGALIIVDYGDGTWAAIDESDAYVSMIDSTTFQIINADAEYLDSVTYQISSTNVDQF